MTENVLALVAVLTMAGGANVFFWQLMLYRRIYKTSHQLHRITENISEKERWKQVLASDDRSRRICKIRNVSLLWFVIFMVLAVVTMGFLYWIEIA